MPIRAVLDTDVWVAALLSPKGASAALLMALEARAYQAVWSEPLVQELRRVLEDPEISRRYRLSRVDLQLLGLLIRRHGREVQITGRSGLSDDPGDDKVVETALRGKVAYLVTFNTQHFAIGTAAGYLSKARVEVVKPVGFLRLVREQARPTRRRARRLTRRLTRPRPNPGDASGGAGTAN